jgi:hypothetical protein
MTREQLEHIIRACAAITNQYEFIIVGSQSILGHDPKTVTAQSFVARIRRWAS